MFNENLFCMQQIIVRFMTVPKQTAVQHEQIQDNVPRDQRDLEASLKAAVLENRFGNFHCVLAHMYSDVCMQQVIVMNGQHFN
jgi:hypothetical protein